MRTSPALIAIVLSASTLTPTFADTPLPSSLGVLLNPADQSITFGSPTTSATLTMNNGSSLTNLGTWTAYTGTIAPNPNFFPTYSGSILNTGTLNINAGAGTFTIQDYSDPNLFPNNISAIPLTFTNLGNINLLSGTFNLAASDTGSSSGTITLSTGTTLGLAGNLTFDANSSLTGSGNVLLSANVRNEPGGNDYIPNTTNTPPAITFNGDYSATGNTTIIGTNVTFNTNATVHNLQILIGTNDFNGTPNPTLGGSGTITLTGSGSPESRISWSGGPTVTTGTISTSAIVVTGTLSLTPGYDQVITLDGTAMTVSAGASLGLGEAGSGETSIAVKKNASIINNGTVFSNAFLDNGSAPNSLTFTNNGTINSFNLSMGTAVRFDNNGTINAYQGFLGFGTLGSDSANSVINLLGATTSVGPRSFLRGTLNNAGTISTSQTGTLGSSLIFHDTGAVNIFDGGHLTLQAAQQADTSGTFLIHSANSPFPTSILEFAANYDFSSPTGPSFLHNSSGDGEIIIDPGITLTLPSDTAFSGTILDNGTLIIAPALNPADAGLAPNFTVLPTPEPASLALLTLAAPLLLRRRVRSPALRR